MTGILVGQILVPVTLGAVAGVIIGTIASQPIVEQTAQSFGLPAAFAFSPSVVALVLAVSVAVALLAAIVPAVHAGRLSAVDAMHAGQPRLVAATVVAFDGWDSACPSACRRDSASRPEPPTRAGPP